MVLVMAVAFALSVLTVGCGGDDDSNDNATPTSATSANVTAQELNAYIGLTEAAAGSKAEREGHPWRVLVRDGVAGPATMDYNPDRLNFELTDGKVTLVTTG
jgi:hypothetical protein